MTEQAKCRSCGQPILWVQMASGRSMPLDPEPTETGTIIIHMGPAIGMEKGRVQTKEETEDRLRRKEPAARVAYVSHFATCPEAQTWRTK